MAAGALHRPGPRYGPAATGTVRMGCGCGERGPARRLLAEAEHDAEAHRAAVAPPPERRCRAPRAHRTAAWWDTCPLCAHQDPIPGLWPDPMTSTDTERRGDGDRDRGDPARR